MPETLPDIEIPSIPEQTPVAADTIRITPAIRAALQRLAQDSATGHPLLLAAFGLASSETQAGETTVEGINPAAELSLIDRLPSVEMSDVLYATAAAVAVAVGYRKWSRNTVSGNLWLLNRRNDWMRRDAAKRLGEVGDRRAVEPLIERLADKNSDVREAATNALGKLGDPRAREPLFARSAVEENRYVLRAVAMALGILGDRRAIGLLEAQLQNVPPTITREIVTNWYYVQTGNYCYEPYEEKETVVETNPEYADINVALNNLRALINSNHGKQ